MRRDSTLDIPNLDVSDFDGVIDAAQSLFYSRGIHAVGMDDISRASGMSLKRLYKTFPSKNDIVFGVLARWHDRWTAGLAAYLAEVAEPRERLLAVFDFLSAWFVSDNFRGCGFINMFGEGGGTSLEIRTIAQAHKDSFQNQMDSLVMLAGAPAYLGPQLSILAEGALTTAAIAGNSAAAGQARAAAQALIGMAMSEH